MPWLAGFPIEQSATDVTWLVVPRYGESRPYTVTIGRTELHQATFASTRLVHRFPRSFPNIVDDPTAWREGLPILLDMLKGVIHGNERLPVSLHTHTAFYPYKVLVLFEEGVARCPELRPLYHALSWVCALNPKELRVALQWAEKNRLALGQVLAYQEKNEGIKTCLMLWHIARQARSKRLTPLLDWLAHPLFFNTPTHDAKAQLGYWQALTEETLGQVWRRDGAPERPSPTLFAELSPFIEWLYTRDRNTRRRALTLFAVVASPKPLNSWPLWWEKVDLLLVDLARLHQDRQYLPDSEALRYRRQQSLAQIRQLQQERPPYFCLAQTVEAIQQISDKTCIDLYTAVTDFLAVMPPFYQGKLTRLPVLCLLLAYDQQYKRPHLVRLCRDWTEHRRKNRTDPVELYLLKDIFIRWHDDRTVYYWTVFSRFLRGSYPFRVLTESLQAWQACLHATMADEMEEFDEDAVVNLLLATGEVEKTATYYQALVTSGLHEEYFDKAHFVAAHLLSENSADFTRFVKIFINMSDHNYRNFEKVGALLALLVEHSWFRLAHDSVLKGHLPLLRKIANLRSALDQMNELTPLPVHPIPRAVPEWCHRYPLMFHPLLSALASLTADAEGTAERLLGKQFPNPNILQREIGAIGRRLIEAAEGQRYGLQKRLSSLQNRLVAPREVSLQKMANLEEKLLQALHSAILQNWHDTLVARLRAKLGQIFDLEAIPDWFLADKQLQIIAPMMEEKAAFRNLGIRLFQERCGPPPWGLRDHAANQGFLRRMEQRKLNMTPWLNPALPRTFEAPTGRHISLALCDDPLDVFHMGGHFRTCLAPGAFNFFAVFANAADINKQLIYGRNEKGQIVGRCLLALTDEGGMVTFEPYTHDPKLEFREMVKIWVTDLAREMNTHVLPDGRVSKLVATDWYDDGATDIAQQFLFLEYSSEFRFSLGRIPLNEFLPELQRQFAPHELNAFTLPLVLNLVELQNRPELVVPLLPFLKNSKNLPIHVLIRAATLAFRAGEVEFARQIMRDLSLTPILEAYKLYEWLDHETMLGLASMAPSTTLKVLRRTRPSKVRHDLQETHPHRVEQYAVAYRALGRQSRALLMRERLATLLKDQAETYVVR